MPPKTPPWLIAEMEDQMNAQTPSISTIIGLRPDAPAQALFSALDRLDAKFLAPLAAAALEAAKSIGLSLPLTGADKLCKILSHASTAAFSAKADEDLDAAFAAEEAAEAAIFEAVNARAAQMLGGLK